MDKWNLFQRFLITESAQVSVVDFLINTGIILVLTLILEFTYTKCAKTLSGRRSFAANFFLVAFTTMLIISIVKSSLALSLGLVGALSIVRFRSAIKEPEELAYLFFTISIGLGLGANQRIVTVVGALVFLLIIWLRYFSSKKSRKQNLYLTVNGQGSSRPSLQHIEQLIADSFYASKLVRYDETKDLIETGYWVEIKRSEELQKFKEEMNHISPDTRVSFVDNSSL